MQVGAGASLGGFVPFPASNGWNIDVTSMPVDANSAAIINHIGATRGLHADFGSGGYGGADTIGIPYVVVNSSQARVRINNTAYEDESDPGPMPIPASAPVEGAPATDGDRHVLVLDKGSCWLYELYRGFRQGDGSWDADQTTVWDLLNNEQRPWGWTSADAAGLSVFAGLIRYDEVAAGEIKHAIRFTVQHSRRAFIPPATHYASSSTDSTYAPMGMRMRLKPGFNVSGFSPANRVILNAMKKYGMIMADNGSNMYISGAPDSRWDNDDLHELASVTAGDFEVLQMTPLYTPSNIPTGPEPVISSFTASDTTISSGQSVTLSWNASGASYFIITPIGPVRGTSVTVSPTATTTYRLYATGAYGRAEDTVTVTVQ